MRALLSISTWILCISSVTCNYKDIQGKVPINLVHDHIKNYVDYSIDPCDDFYAHACPESANLRFLHFLEQTKNNLVAEHKMNETFYERFSTQMKLETSETLAKLKNPYYNNEFFMNDIANITLEGFEKFTKEQKDELLKKIVDGNNFYPEYKQELISVSNGYIASKLFNDLDAKARKYFAKLKTAARKSIGVTPWTKTNHATELFQKTLDDINFYTFSDARGAVELWMEKYNSVFDSCFEILTEDYGMETGVALCDVLAVHKSRRLFDQQNIPVMSYIRKELVADTLDMFNANENVVFISSSILLLFSSDFQSDVFGSIGFTLLHEIFHSLVFGEDDKAYGHPLLPFASKNTDCVAEQAKKTCETFNTVRGPNGEEQGCDPVRTFEEDAADIAAYRIAWKLYSQGYARKTVVPNFESLNKQQLFFYGASTMLCSPEAMHIKPSRDNVHSNDYQRVNSLMSQMPAFSKAFSCKATDKMVMNMATPCVLYGPRAPATRRKSSVH